MFRLILDFAKLNNIKDYLFLWLFRDCLNNYLEFRTIYQRTYLRFYLLNVYYKAYHLWHNQINFYTKVIKVLHNSIFSRLFSKYLSRHLDVFYHLLWVNCLLFFLICLHRSEVIYPKCSKLLRRLWLNQPLYLSHLWILDLI